MSQIAKQQAAILRAEQRLQAFKQMRSDAASAQQNDGTQPEYGLVHRKGLPKMS